MMIYRNNPRLFNQTARLIRKGWSTSRIMDELLLPFDYVAEIRDVLDALAEAERLLDTMPRDPQRVISNRRRELVAEAYAA